MGHSVTLIERGDEGCSAFSDHNILAL